MDKKIESSQQVMQRKRRSSGKSEVHTLDFRSWRTSIELVVEFSPSRGELMQDRPMVNIGRPAFGPRPPIPSLFRIYL